MIIHLFFFIMFYMEYIFIGKILNTHGIKGDLKVVSFSDFDDDRYKKGSLVYVGEEKKEYKIAQYRNHQSILLVRFVDNEDINLVEKLKNQNIYKAKDDIKPLKKGEYYFSDLKDLDVFMDNELIGKVIRVEEGMTHNNLRVLTNKDNKEHLIPYVKDVFILNVDLDSNRIDIKDVVGLI